MSAKPKIIARIYDKRGRLLSTGRNSFVKTHPYQAQMAEETGRPHRQFLHAEIAAIIKCKGVPHKIKIERRDGNGKLRLSKPCPACELAIKLAKIKYIEYST